MGQKQVKCQQVLSLGTFFPSVLFRAYDSSSSIVYCPLSKCLFLNTFWQLLLAAVNVASSFKLWILVLSWELLSSFNTVFLGPHIQPGVVAHSILPLMTISSPWVLSSSNWLLQPGLFLREASLSGTRFTGFSWLMES